MIALVATSLDLIDHLVSNISWADTEAIFAEDLDAHIFLAVEETVWTTNDRATRG